MKLNIDNASTLSRFPVLFKNSRADLWEGVGGNAIFSDILVLKINSSKRKLPAGQHVKLETQERLRVASSWSETLGAPAA